MTGAALAAGIVGAALLFVGVPVLICKLISTGDRVEGADVPFAEPHDAHIREAIAVANDDPDPAFITRTRDLVVDELARRRAVRS